MHDDSSPLCARFLSAADLLGRRWTGVILRILMDGPCRFGELTARIGTISERVLSERLKDLEAEGILERHVDPGPPIRSEYRLTEKGQAFWKVIDELGKWAERWVDVKPTRAAPRKRKSA
ncbi:helix-turn-helix transcriptional regulator [Corallococcus exiguus]|uniref:MarR family transcriptional regulator n=1 Tax=Corallococcus exiguus TaxID=83462 RepID=A0A7Y1S9C4_9BACT|nr:MULTISPECIES: helix-turn-helix domain-containing protein [Corallococcus]NBC45758.1 MarR family transcriptional regulator [Corallococcus exiguus]NNC20008.1 helix-turn-helix transcriptional regulator [Corallococcus exiguus]NPD26614.1 helix-turn-helix transcriptional regulator [Corallococcus exiguus]NRD50509.1 helix-turn-helix transcriptional regulator [Corallococcus exiguus]NRD58971.1 helix-turn-helix transcriptional regulator [Corallococcus exiguus]